MDMHPDGRQPGQQRNSVSILAREFAAKFSTKRECFNFLTLDCDAYLPHFDTVTIYFLKDLISGKRKCKCFFIPY